MLKSLGAAAVTAALVAAAMNGPVRHGHTDKRC
jgi:hypothetical protein